MIEVWETFGFYDVKEKQDESACGRAQKRVSQKSIMMSGNQLVINMSFRCLEGGDGWGFPDVLQASAAGCCRHSDWLVSDEQHHVNASD